MFNRVAGKLETCANIAIIVVAVLIGLVFIKSYVLADRAQPQPRNPVGTKVSLPGVDWAKNGQTILLVLQKGCHFCSESAPFYQQLVKETADNGKVRLIALLPQKVDEGRGYLSELGVTVQEVKQTPLNSLGVTGTPTLLWVNGEGVVTNSWKGKLPVEKESEVLAKLRQCGASQRCG
jgi:thiol-disulfide isomerase/thioredoxin